MGHIKEPKGVDFVVDPTPLTAGDRKKISEAIAHYKATGRKLSQRDHTAKKVASNTSKKRITTH